MLFHQIEFAVLLAAVLVFLRVVRNFRAQKAFLLLASYYFYAYWDWRFLGLLASTTLIDYAIGMALGRTEQPRRRKALLVVSLVANLGVLGFFKYFNFFVASAAAALAPFGLHVGTLSILLPVGISFYTFQSLSYTIDVYRRNIRPCRNPFDFALFVAFFPQLVAGPIVRAADFLPQLQTPRTMDWNKTFLGLRQFVIGLAKKVLVADRLAFTVDTVFANPGVFDGWTTWLAVLCYALQIYCDFSGYSDMAIGVARVMGYELRPNFNMPYIATSIRDFWRRWHISLSSWLRDYLYIPLGGSRKGPRRTYINLMLTMLLGGLWHGAAWTFVAWGGLHGAALAVDKFAGNRRSRTNSPAGGGPGRGVLRSFPGWAITMLIVLVGWVLFRSPSFATAGIVLTNMAGLGQGFVHWIPPYSLLVVVLMIGLHVIHAAGRQHWLELPAERLLTPTVLFTLLWLVILLYPTGFHPFIYFQF